ncbi:hypothetical protein BDW62DRAFT_204543 [Aspergillus aurantiobrunneus]
MSAPHVRPMSPRSRPSAWTPQTINGSRGGTFAPGPRQPVRAAPLNMAGNPQDRTAAPPRGYHAQIAAPRPQYPAGYHQRAHSGTVPHNQTVQQPVTHWATVDGSRNSTGVQVQAYRPMPPRPSGDMNIRPYNAPAPNRQFPQPPMQPVEHRKPVIELTGNEDEETPIPGNRELERLGSLLASQGHLKERLKVLTRAILQLQEASGIEGRRFLEEETAVLNSMLEEEQTSLAFAAQRITQLEAKVFQLHGRCTERTVPDAKPDSPKRRSISVQELLV